MKTLKQYIFEARNINEDTDISLQEEIVAQVNKYMELTKKSKTDLLKNIESDDEFSKEFVTEIAKNTFNIDKDNNLADFFDFTEQVILSFLNGKTDKIEERFISGQEPKNLDDPDADKRLTGYKYKYNPNDTDIHVDDIVYTSWGYSMTLVDFYKVISVGPKSIRIRELESKVVSGDGMVGNIAPIEDKFYGNNFKRR